MRLSVLLLISFIVAVIAILVWAACSYHALAQLRVVSVDEFANVRTNLFNVDSELIRNEVGNLEGGDFSKALTLCAWVTNQVNTDKQGNIPSSNRTPYKVLEAMRKGETGVSCGYRSLLFTSALQNSGIEARMITALSEDNKFVHTTTEVLINGKWVVIDPTYNVYFKVNGELASATDLHFSNDIEVINGNNNADPVKYDSALLGAFKHISVYERRYHAPWQMLPLVQFFYGGSVVVLEGSHIVTPFRVVTRNIMVGLYNFVLPLGIYSCVFVILAEKMKC